jgi:hypothetical protein
MKDAFILLKNFCGAKMQNPKGSFLSGFVFLVRLIVVIRLCLDYFATCVTARVAASARQVRQNRTNPPRPRTPGRQSQLVKCANCGDWHSDRVI